MVIFLDFDGVLHRKMNGNFEFLSNFIQILDMYPDVQVVISSDWRKTMSIKDYLDIFGEYTAKIIGEIDDIPNKTRQELILHYVNKNLIKKFIAIDDDCRQDNFDKECNWLFKTNYFEGLNNIATNELIRFIKLRRSF